MLTRLGFKLSTVDYWRKLRLSASFLPKNCVNTSMSNLASQLPESKVDISDEAVQDQTHGVKRKTTETSLDRVTSHSKRSRWNALKDNKYDDTEYYFDKGLRKVYPYYYTYNAFCKGRWVGRKLLDVFAQEFRAFTPEQYKAKLERGTVTVNGKQVTIDTVLRDNDLIQSKVHRHEVPVLASPLPIVHNSDELLVIDKPPSLPVHPCGRYRHNSVAFILAKELKFKDLHIIHRLDRLTSGLLLLGKTPQKAKQLMKEISGREVSKEYVCRVEGNFPDESITMEEPIEMLSHKIGICFVGPKGKSAKTEFKKLSYNGKSSVLLCRPLTGRMHQIRVHLQYLGYPIINDPMYNSYIFGPNKGKGGVFGKTKEQLLEEIVKAHNIENWFEDSNTDGDEQPNCSSKVDSHEVCPETQVVKDSSTLAQCKSFYSSLAHYINQPAYQELCEKYKFDPSKVAFDENCFDCQNKCKDPEPKDLIMLLHAFKYKGTDWEFETKMPAWADENWDLL